MSRILIAGGGGFGLEIYGYIISDLTAAQHPQPPTVGILNDSPDCEVLKKIPDALHCGGIQDYRPVPEDTVVIAIGSTDGRRKIAEVLRKKGARLLTYIHPTALIAKNSVIGEGSIICPHSIVNTGARVDENVLVNVFCSIGHNAHVKSHSILSPYCSMSGDSVLGESGFMGTRATLFPKVEIGPECIVDAHSAVRQSTPARKIISSRGQYLVLDNRAISKT